MNENVSKISTLLERLESSKQVTSSDIVYLFNHTRQILEAENLNSKYIILNFYCNWIAHTKLSGSVHIFKVLEELQVKLLCCFDSTDKSQKELSKMESDFIIRAVSDALDLEKLRKEFITLYGTKGLSTSLFMRCNWPPFIGEILSEVSKKPIMYPKGTSDLNEVPNRNGVQKKAYNSYQRQKRKITDKYLKIHSDPRTFIVTQLYIESDEESQKYRWVIRTHPKLTIKAPLYLKFKGK